MSNPGLEVELKRKIFGILFALVLALSFSLVTAVPVSAGAITSIVYTPSGATVWTYVAASSTVCTFDPETAITAGNTITLTLPHGTTLANIVAGDFTIAQVGGAANAPSDLAFNSDARTITFTVAAGSLSGTGLGVVTISTSGTADGDEIRHPITKTTTGTFSVATSVTDSGLISNVVFVPGPAHHLGFWPPQPTTAVAGVVIAAPNVVVKIQDAYGNPTSDTDNITVAIDNNPGGGTLSGTLMVAALNGVATFSDLSIEKTGTGYTLEAISGVLIHGISPPFNITPGALASFTITGTPATALPGVPFPSPANDITVTARDGFGNIKTYYQGTVTWSSTAVATLPADHTFVGLDAGVHTFLGSEFSLSSIGTQTITVTDAFAAVSATSSGIAVATLTGGGIPPSDTTPPTISGISTSNITGTGADIGWRTNEWSTSQAEYWSNPSRLSPLDETMCLDHLTDLTPGTTYHYKTMSVDRADNLAVSDEHTFTTLGEAPAAAFSASDLSISPSEVNIGETITISVLVANTGSAAGSYEVTLKINDVAEATKEVTVDAGASEEVTFTTEKDVAGSYSVAVNGLSGSFTVKEKPVPAPPPPPPAPPPEVKAVINWPVIGGLIAAVVVGLLILFLVRRRA